ncbi:MAG: DMT family transporter [Pseudomonadota bacterium]
MSGAIGEAGKRPAHPVGLYWLALATSGVLWGVTGPLSKIAVSTGHHPLGIAFWSTLASVIVMTAIMVVRRRRLPLSREHIVFYSICGFLGTAFPHTLSYAAYQVVSVGIAVIILSLVPILTFLVALLLRFEALDLRRAFGLVLGLIAVLMIMLPDSSLPDRSHLPWVIVLLLVAVSYSSETLYIARKKPANVDALATLCGLSWAALIMLAVAVPLADAWVDISRFETAEQAAILMALFHIASYFTFIWLVSQAGPVFAVQTGYLVTATGVLIGLFYFGDRLGPFVWVALFLMMVGIFFVKPKESQDR